MRNSKLLLIGIGLLLAGALIFAGQAQAASIKNSKHDLSSGSTTTGWKSTTENQICIFCHTPHNALPALVPLWNHTTTGTTFTLYPSGGTLNATPGQPTGASKACLSCHDGTVALDSYGGSIGTNTNMMTGGALLGTDLSNDHPISFTYDAALVTSDGGLNDPAALTGVKLFSNKMECASCHNVHDPAISKFLRISNSGSALCLECHKK